MPSCLVGDPLRHQGLVKDAPCQLDAVIMTALQVMQQVQSEVGKPCIICVNVDHVLTLCALPVGPPSRMLHAASTGRRRSLRQTGRRWWGGRASCRSFSIRRSA